MTRQPLAAGGAAVALALAGCFFELPPLADAVPDNETADAAVSRRDAEALVPTIADAGLTRFCSQPSLADASCADFDDGQVAPPFVPSAGEPGVEVKVEGGELVCRVEETTLLRDGSISTSVPGTGSLRVEVSVNIVDARLLGGAGRAELVQVYFPAQYIGAPEQSFTFSAEGRGPDIGPVAAFVSKLGGAPTTTDRRGATLVRGVAHRVTLDVASGRFVLAVDGVVLFDETPTFRAFDASGRRVRVGVVTRDGPTPAITARFDDIAVFAK